MHGAHVDFVEGGEDRRRGLRLAQPLGDALAQPRHRHALDLGVPLGAARRTGRGGYGVGGRGASVHRRRRAARRVRGGRSVAGGVGVEVREHVALGQAAASAGAGDLLRIELCSSTSRRTAGESGCVAAGCGRRRRCGRRRWRRLGPAARRRRQLAPARLRAACAGAGATARRRASMRATTSPTLHGRALLGERP